MSKGSLLCSLVLVQVVCILQLCLISSSSQPPQLTGGDSFLRRDPIGRPRLLMSSRGRDQELSDGHSADSIFDEEELSDGGGLISPVDEYSTDGGGVLAEEEEDQGWLPDDDGGGGGGAKGSSSGGSVGGGDVVCPECGKCFKNDKSMFGHLRSHPNRGYRGANPPVNKLKLSPETAAGAAAASPSPSSPPSGENSPTQQQLPPGPPSSPVVGAAIDEQTAVYASGSRGKATSNAAAGGHADLDLDEYSGGSGSVVRIPTKRRNMIIREAHRKKARLVPLPTPPPPPPPKEKGPYICKHCSAEFATHQALGGHMAGHHRDKKVPTTLNDASSSRAHQHQDGKMQVKGGGGDDDDNGCWRDDSGLSLRRGLLSEQLSMPSNVPRRQSGGQASGGHIIEMRQQQHSRRRNDGLTMAAQAPPPAPAPAPALTQADDSGGRRLLNIDLNAEATEEE